MADQRKTWDREDRKRRYGVRVVDTERPSWLLNLNEPRDVDEHPARLVQLSEADIPPPRRLRRERRWFRRERRRKRRYRARGVDTERPSWLLNLNEPRDVDDELPPRDVDDERPSWLLNLNEPREHAQRTATAVQWWGKLVDTNLGERSCYVAGRRRRVLPNGPIWRRCGHEQTAAIFRITSSTIGSSQSEEQFGFHARRIVARLRIRATSATLKKTMLRRWALRQFKFNASLGYPGEGPPMVGARMTGGVDTSEKRVFSCKSCSRPFARERNRDRHAMTCKGLKTCPCCPHRKIYNIIRSVLQR